MKKLGVKEGEIWKSTGNKSKETSSSSKSSSGVFSFQASDLSQSPAEKDPSSLPLEESKENLKFFELPLDFKTKVKKGTPNELGFDASFASLTMNDFLEEIPEDTKGRDLILRAREEALRLFQEINQEFTRAKPSNQVGIYTRDNGSDGNSVLGVGEIPYSIDKIAETLCDETQRKGFDKLLEEAKIIEELPHMTFIMHAKFKKVLILSARDFVC